MTQKISPFVEAKFGWEFGESGWNSGMDENLLKFSFLFNGNIDGIISQLPAPVNGESYFLETDGRVYFAVQGSWQSTPIPKWFILKDKISGINYQYDGVLLSEIASSQELEESVTQIQASIEQLGSAAYRDEGYFLNTGDATQLEESLDAKIDELSSNLGTVSVKKYGAVGDGETDDTVAIQSAIEDAQLSGASLIIPSGLYIVTNLSVTSNLCILGCGDNSKLKRKNNTVFESGSPTQSILSINSHGITVTIRDILLDGNEVNQSLYAAYGSLISATDVSGVPGDKLNITVENCTLINSTQYGVYIDGDTSSSGHEEVKVNNCRFYDGRVGLAAGDPRVASTSGFGPDYVRVTDRVYLTVRDSTFLFGKTLQAEEFAPTAIRVTFSVDTNNLDSCRAVISGNYFYGCGRGDRVVGGVTYRAQNGIGVIDFYARGREIRITDNTFFHSQSAPIRGKTNCELLLVSGNTIDTCNMNPGISVGPNTYPQQAGRIVISGNAIMNAASFGIAVVGNAGSLTKGSEDNTQKYVTDITISDNIIGQISAFDSGDNPNTGEGIYVRNGRNISITGNVMRDIAQRGIWVRGTSGTYNTENVSISGNVVDGSGLMGIMCDGGITGGVTITSNIIKNSASNGIRGEGEISTQASFMRQGNSVSGAVDYGLYATGFLAVGFQNNTVQNISGVSRGYRADGTTSFRLLGNSALSGVTESVSPSSGSSSPTRTEHSNSWNPIITYSTAAPASGTWKRNDMVYNSAVSASGNIGWVCTVAGTPGTWKTFGTISA